MSHRKSTALGLGALALVAQIGVSVAQGPGSGSGGPAAPPNSLRDQTTGPTNPNPNPTPELSTSGQRPNPRDPVTKHSERSPDRAPRPDGTDRANPPLR